MFTFLKSLFSDSEKVFSLGALPSPEDPRNISTTSLPTSGSIPSEYMTDLSMIGVSDQKDGQICVGESFATIASYYVYKNTGQIVTFDPLNLYNQCKKEDGIPEESGTYASVAAKIVVRDGIDKIGMDSSDKVANGYAYVPNDFDSVCSAIHNYGMVSIGMQIDARWFKGIIGRALSYIGGHQTALHGYSYLDQYVYGINSWGVGWIGHIAGILDSKVAPGHYVANYYDIKNAIMNMIVLAPIPKEILDVAKNTDYKFTTPMKLGSSGYEVTKLQERLGILPTTGYFWYITKEKVQAFQKSVGLTDDGFIGANTLNALNTKTAALGKLDLWAKAIQEHEGWTPGSRSYRNNNPGNLKYIGQKRATGADTSNFCVFKTYADGFQELKDQLMRAATPPANGRYTPEMSLAAFFKVYAPSSDNNDPVRYATVVAQRIGCVVDTAIKNLI